MIELIHCLEVLELLQATMLTPKVGTTTGETVVVPDATKNQKGLGMVGELTQHATLAEMAEFVANVPNSMRSLTIDRLPLPPEGLDRAMLFEEMGRILLSPGETGDLIASADAKERVTQYRREQ